MSGSYTPAATERRVAERVACRIRHQLDGDAVELGDVVVQDAAARVLVEVRACSASSAWLFGHVASLCGKSFAHIRRSGFMRSAMRNATQSSWNVRYTLLAELLARRRDSSPAVSQLRWRS